MTGNQVSVNLPDYTIRNTTIQGKKNVRVAKGVKAGVTQLALRGMMMH